MSALIHAHLQERIQTLLFPLVEPGDVDLSDAEFIYRLQKRFFYEWIAKQHLIDPNE